jgi:glycosyltransferase involved in cell wall biosynthesis
MKIAVIVESLRTGGHVLDLLSEGEVDAFRCHYYPGFSEVDDACGGIVIQYASALPLRMLGGLWSSFRMLRLVIAGHRRAPYQAVIVYNLKQSHVSCIRYASRTLGVPVILQYEDDAFVNIAGQRSRGLLSRRRDRGCHDAMRRVTAGIAVSPRLQSQFRKTVPTLLLRGVVAQDIIRCGNRPESEKRNWVLFSGGHSASKGVQQLIHGWRESKIPDWELHITGCGPLSGTLRQLAAGTPRVVFHGLVERSALVELMCVSRLCINPHDVSSSPGNVFAFKIVEYLAAGAHVITTPMGALEPEIEKGITYIPDNLPRTIAAALSGVVEKQQWRNNACDEVCRIYGPQAVARKLDDLLNLATAPRHG